MSRNIILFDCPLAFTALLPFTFTRPISMIRCGVDTIYEKWNHFLPGNYSFKSADFLQSKYPTIETSDNWYINGAIFPESTLVDKIESLGLEQALVLENGTVVAYRTEKTWGIVTDLSEIDEIQFQGEIICLTSKWDIMSFNGEQIKSDFIRIVSGRKSAPITDRWTAVYHEENIFIEEGANIKAASLNAENGPIYIGKNAVIQEGASIQGPFALCENSVVAQGSKIRPNTTVGPYSKVGGEVSGSVFLGNGNKGHEGYLGNSVIGEWCNLGALTTNSNLKNDFTNVKLHSYDKEILEDTGLTFCGLFMGDYSKSGIGTLFNTGTVVGVHANVFGGGLQKKFIPSFTWGGTAEGLSVYRLEKALEVAAVTVQKKGATFEQEDADILKSVFRMELDQVR